jgi:hypothetical protein
MTEIGFLLCSPLCRLCSNPPHNQIYLHKIMYNRNTGSLSRNYILMFKLIIYEGVLEGDGFTSSLGGGSLLLALSTGDLSFPLYFIPLRVSFLSIFYNNPPSEVPSIQLQKVIPYSRNPMFRV